MRALQLVVLALGVLWGGYWLVGSYVLQKAAVGWFAAQVSAGRVASNTGVEVDGFPNRFDLTVTGLHLADPVTGLAWDAPFAQVFSMTWKPWHLIAALPDSQTFTLPDQTVGLVSTKLQGSLVLVPGTGLALDRIVVDGAELAATSSQGWVVRASRAELATRQDATAANRHEVNLTLTGLMPDPALLEAMADTSDLPAVIETAQIDAVAGFSAPIDRFAGNTRPQLVTLAVKQSQIRWGDMVLAANGTLSADAGGLAEGRIELSLKNWRKVLPPAVALGLVKPEVAPTVERVMETLAQQSGDPAVLKLPLVMQSGRMSLGPIPLGPAPRLVQVPQG